MQKCFWAVLTFSVGALILSIILYLANVGESVRNALIRKNFVLSPENKEYFESWKKPVDGDGNLIGSDYDFYLWNITNPKEVLTGSKPKLQEVGPFCYVNYNEHVNISTKMMDRTVKG